MNHTVHCLLVRVPDHADSVAMGGLTTITDLIEYSDIPGTWEKGNMQISL